MPTPGIGGDAVTSLQYDECNFIIYCTEVCLVCALKCFFLRGELKGRGYWVLFVWGFYHSF